MHAATGFMLTTSDEITVITETLKHKLIQMTNETVSDVVDAANHNKTSSRLIKSSNKLTKVVDTAFKEINLKMLNTSYEMRVRQVLMRAIVRIGRDFDGIYHLHEATRLNMNGQETIKMVYNDDDSSENSTTDQVTTENITTGQVIAVNNSNNQGIAKNITREQVITKKFATDHVKTENILRDKVITGNVTTDKVITSEFTADLFTTENVIIMHPVATEKLTRDLVNEY